MFNHFFFGSHRSEKAFQSFVRSEGLLLVMDPPFGGLAEVLAASVKTIWDVWSKAHSDGKIYWIKWKTECLVFPKVRNNVSYSTTVDCFELYLLSLQNTCTVYFNLSFIRTGIQKSGAKAHMCIVCSACSVFFSLPQQNLSVLPCFQGCRYDSFSDR